MGRFSILVAAICYLMIAVNCVEAADAPAAAPAAPYWQPEKFPISFWCGPPKEFVTPERFKQIADAGFTLVFPPCGPTDVETNHKILDYCQANGLKAFIGDARIPTDGSTPAAKKAIDAVVADYSSHPALAGYFVCDEPGGGAFPTLGQAVQYFREKDPKHPAYCNLLPNYAPQWALATPSYDTHVENFVDIVKPAIVSYDHYHLHKQFDASGFFANLQTVRRISVQNNVPFWNIVLLINHFDYRSPSENELKWEAMQTVAYGGKGVMFFTYWQPGNDGTWGEAIIDFKGNPTKKYEQITRVNHDIQAVGKYLLHATSLRSYQFGQGGDETHTADLPIRFEGPNITVGFFQDDKTHYALFANRDYKNEVSTDVFLKTDGHKITKLDKKTDQWSDVETQPTGESKVALHIEAGDGDLYRW